MYISIIISQYHDKSLIKLGWFNFTNFEPSNLGRSMNGSILKKTGNIRTVKTVLDGPNGPVRTSPGPSKAIQTLL